MASKIQRAKERARYVIMARLRQYITLTTSILVAAILVALLVVAPSVDFAFKSYLTSRNWMYALLVVLCIGLYAFVGTGRLAGAKADANYAGGQVADRFWHVKSRDVLILVALSILLFVLQLIIIHFGWFVSGWDVGNITDIEHVNMYENYYAQYPNNLLIGGILVRLHVIATALGITPYVLFCAGGALCVTVSIFEISLIAYKYWGLAFSLVVFGVSAVLLGLHPYILVPYSDAYAGVCVTTMLCVATYTKHPFVSVVVWALVAPVAYSLKPTTVFMAAAVGASLVYALYKISDHGDVFGLLKGGKKIKAFALNVSLAIVLALFSGMAGTAVSAHMKDFGLKPNVDRYALPVSSWFMMGLNEEMYGSYNGADVMYLWNYDTKDEKDTQARERIHERLSDLGASGVAALYGKKVLSAWGSGAFGWEPPGAYKEIREDVHPALSWWYGYDSANYTIANHKNNVFEVPYQFIWIALLIGIAGIGVSSVMFLILRKKSSPQHEIIFEKPLAISSFSLVCLTVFLMLFETNSRQMYLYGPEIVLLGCWGLLMTKHSIDVMFEQSSEN
ncbi:MAG: hypothetical protein IJV62_00170 [Eggerthellaceae bacterium]|nr:hypothetical protein [Eggerthellaceae bacterium]